MTTHFIHGSAPAAAVSPLKRPANAQAPSADASKKMTLFVLIVVTLYFGKEVLIPITLALLLAFILSPLVNLLRRLRLGRTPSVLVAVVLALGLVLAIGGVIGTQVADLSTGLPKYATVVQTKVNTVRTYTVGRLSSLADKVGARNAMPDTDAPPSTTPKPEREKTDAVSAPAATQSTPLDLLKTYLAPILGPIGTFGIVFIVAVFALLQREDLRDRSIRLLGSNDLHRTTLAIDDGGSRLSRYFLTQLCINAVFGVVIGVGLLLIGVPNPVLWGILSALLRFVPYVGTPIAALLPMALAAAVEPGWSTLAWTAGLYLIVEAVTGQAIEPSVYGHSTGLSPFSVVVAAIFWSWLWGPVGLILSTPLTLCLVVLGRHVKKLEFLDVMLGDRPALTPIESFYQRILAGDADETQDHAETLLKEIALSAYYDEVALKGLQLAASDVQRGVLDDDQLERIKTTIAALVAGLAEREDREPSHEKSANDKSDKTALPASHVDDGLTHTPPPHSVDPTDPLAVAWESPAYVLCIAGRGPLDEAAAMMLVQLLEKHGMRGRMVSHYEVSRTGVDALDVTGASMACVSYLDITGAPAHLRYLMRRLRRRLADKTPILVGLWPTQDSTLKDKNVQQEIGADYFTSSLTEAVNACAHEAKRDRENAGDAALSIASHPA